MLWLRTWSLRNLTRKELFLNARSFASQFVHRKQLLRTGVGLHGLLNNAFLDTCIFLCVNSVVGSIDSVKFWLGKTVVFSHKVWKADLIYVSLTHLTGYKLTYFICYCYSVSGDILADHVSVSPTRSGFSRVLLRLRTLTSFPDLCAVHQTPSSNDAIFRIIRIIWSVDSLTLLSLVGR